MLLFLKKKNVVAQNKHHNSLTYRRGGGFKISETKEDESLYTCS